jgi:hypothetical protein
MRILGGILIIGGHQTWYSCSVMINDHELGATEAVRLE